MIPLAAPCCAHIRLDALRHNLHHLGTPETLMPVIKSDAYGHGLVPVARVLAEEGVTHMAVGFAAEGLRLRQEGIGAALIALMGATSAEELQQAATRRITLAVHSFASLQRVAACATPDTPLPIAIKCDTGMSRLGFIPEDLPALLEQLRATPALEPVLAFSHLSCADMPEVVDYSTRQMDRFAAMTASLSEAFPTLRRSLANSAAALALSQARHDLIRPGLALYGCNPFRKTVLETCGKRLEPAMSVSATVLHVREIAPGTSVSYGRLFTAVRPTRLAVISAGYADGYARALTNRAEVCIHGQRVPLRGRICMGMCMADITDLATPVCEGDQAWLMGGPGDTPVTADELADLLGTIPYEVLCQLGKNPRSYE